MKTQRKVLGMVLAFFGVLAVLAGWYLHRHPVPVLQPAGEIGDRERNLMIFTVSLSLVVVIPVFAMLVGFALRYREGNPRQGRYNPELDGNRTAETIWWLIPAILIATIGTITWRTSYSLDPFKPLGGKTEHIQVVALDWKWLFIYPDQHVASVNTVYVPVGEPVEFDITSDTVMTSFWVPQLAGQMYAMPGMVTKLNLRADKPGEYHGVAANISGEGFADQAFEVEAVQPQAYQESVDAMQVGNSALTSKAYAALARPSVLQAGDVRYYSSVSPALYDTIVVKYMMPTSGSNSVNAANLGVSF